MARHFRDEWHVTDIRCPFFISLDRKMRKITCEGFGERSKNTSQFANLAIRDRHMGKYCTSNFERCPVYRMVYNEKYADE